MATNVKATSMTLDTTVPRVPVNAPLKTTALAPLAASVSPLAVVPVPMSIAPLNVDVPEVKSGAPPTV